MFKTLFAALGAVSLTAIPTLAEVSGAELSLGYSGLADGGARDINKMTLGAGLEFALSPQVSVQGDLTKTWYGVMDGSGESYAAHGIFHMPSGAALGGFVGRDVLDGADVEFYGLEAGGAFGAVDVEGALSWLDGAGNDGFGLSLSGDYTIAPQVAVGGTFATLSADSGDAWRLSGTGAYQILPGLQAQGEVGLYDGDGINTETFVGFGLKATFGGDGITRSGTTFGKRGLQEFTPGF